MSTFEATSRKSPQTPGQSTVEQRLSLEHLTDAATTTELASDSDVIQGLTCTPKSLPAHYFYDDRGSQLFEEICELPEYYPTRTEAGILRRFSGAIARITGPCELVELGSGSSVKTRILLDAYKNLGHPLRYVPIDVSAGILKSSAQALLTDYPALQVQGLIGTYEMAMAQLAPARLPARMIFFLGSTLGNLNPQECNQFFDQIKAALQPGDYFLLGIDLQKSKTQLEAAYNDSQGITAAFNLNMLQHLNGRFDGNFDLSQFEHWAFYNESLHQIEMHLRSLRSQTVQLKALNLTVGFEAGETILSEISRKFNLQQVQQELQAKGLTPVKAWTDEQQWFGLVLCQL